jgi:PAS domain S-box-containing protein
MMGTSIKVKIIVFVTIIVLLISAATALFILSSFEKTASGLMGSEQLKSETILFFAGVIVFCMTCSVIFAVTLIKPVDELIIATQLIAEGQYDKEIESRRDDEVGRLVLAFNDMAKKISRTKKESTKFSEIALIEKQKTSLIIDAMADGVIVTDESHRIIMFNPAAEKLFDMGKNKMQGRHIAHLLRRFKMDRLFLCFPEIDRENLLPIKRTWVDSVEISLEKPKKRVIRATVAPIKNERHIITGTVTVIEDITKLKELEEIKNNFVSTVSHELRTPLTNIIGYTSLLLNERFDKLNPQQKKALEVISSESNILHELINDILDLSKLEAGKAKMRFEKLNIKELIEKCNALKLPQKKNISLKLILAERLHYITGDRAKLTQVFTNLISNATKFTNEGGMITIRAFNKKEHVQVDIADTGIGIKNQHIPLIFNRFYQVQSHLTRTQAGTGLGLSIVKEIVGLHHGLISVKSRIGKGTTISIAIPIEQPKEGNMDQVPYCWESKRCRKIKCQAYQSDDKRCWLHMGTYCRKNSNEPVSDKIEVCSYCSIYRKAIAAKKEDLEKKKQEKYETEDHQ